MDFCLFYIYYNEKEDIRIIDSDNLIFYEKVSFYFKEKKNLFQK